MVDGEPPPPPKWRAEKGGGRDFGNALPVMFMLALTVGAILTRIFGRIGGADHRRRHQRRRVVHPEQPTMATFAGLHRIHGRDLRALVARSG